MVCMWKRKGGLSTQREFFKGSVVNVQENWDFWKLPSAQSERRMLFFLVWLLTKRTQIPKIHSEPQTILYEWEGKDHKSLSTSNSIITMI